MRKVKRFGEERTKTKNNVWTVLRWALRMWATQQAGRIEDAEMSRTFNMGIGMVLVVTEEASRKILEEGQHKAYRIGEVVCGEGVRYC
ncbi:hypothetical protein POTOM_048338 [Populus tomentosa]|uniref:PurM-like C-terminal domain-containing protein n=1 Tax=Populus tomentosa TaxID=118781 RepID=A0A8X8CBS5_POPTO|nr:hypothetical protein POTOM_048338 [Populus tomentosa]